MRTLAKTFGLSDVDLAKVCKSHNIPRPPVGYWAKIEAGQMLTKPLLPKVEGSEDQVITLWDEPSPVPKQEPSPEFDPDIMELLDKVNQIGPITISDALRNLDPLVKQVQDKLSESSIDDDNMVGSYSRREAVVEVHVAKANVRRSLLFLDTLFKTIKKIGGSISVSKRNEWEPSKTEIKIAGGVISGLRLRERYKQVKREQNSKDRWSYRTNDHVPTGRLVLDKGPSYWTNNIYCEDSAKSGRRIEDRINFLIASWIREIGLERIERRHEEAVRKVQMERERIERENEAVLKRRRDELTSLQKAEQARVDKLIQEADRWCQSQRIREYLAAIKEAAAHRQLPAESREEIDTFLKWAQDQASRLDPLTPSPLSVLDQSVDGIKLDK